MLLPASWALACRGRLLSVRTFSRAAAMPQKTLDGFVVHKTKRPRLEAQPAAQASTVAAAAMQQAGQEPGTAEPAGEAPAVASGPNSSSGDGAAPQEQPTAPVGDAGRGPRGGAGGGGAPAAAAATATTAEEQQAQYQRLRAHANRNSALAKQAVIGCERSGTLPALADLLVEESWKALLAEEFKKPYFRDLERFVQAEWGSGKMVFPPKDAIFRAFNSCPVDQVRVVILGQDPYHDLGQAMGLSFSVPKGKAVPSSLRNIYKELRDDCACTVPSHGNLEKWAQQGVLLLNAVLTVQAHKAGSHAKKGWEQFTEAAISKLSKHHSGLVFLLWGRFAQEKERVICPNKHHILKCAHPSGLSASRGFFGCRHFSQTNALLAREGCLPIDWQIED